jgi:hypothetical protein
MLGKAASRRRHFIGTSNPEWDFSHRIKLTYGRLSNSLLPEGSIWKLNVWMLPFILF